MSVVVGVLLGAGLASVIGIGWMLVRAPRAGRTPAAIGMQSALHAATATLPHLRRGLSADSAAHAGPHLRERHGAGAVELDRAGAVLAIDGEGGEQVRPGDMLSRLLSRTRDDRV